MIIKIALVVAIISFCVVCLSLFGIFVDSCIDPPDWLGGLIMWGFLIGVPVCLVSLTVGLVVKVLGG